MDRQRLIQAAMETMSRAYAPYSHHQVGAALLCSDGSIYTGFNIENAAYSPTICAERNALIRAIHDGRRDFEAIAICGGVDGKAVDFCAPCGVCRQVMREFCDENSFLVILAREDGSYQEWTLAELLPMGFGPANLITRF